MAWQIELTEHARKDLKKPDKPIARRVVAFLHEISLPDNPRSKGKSLTENLSGYWRYRLAGRRIICTIGDNTITVLFIRHRREAYR